MDRAIPLHHNRIGTTKGTWQISVCSALVVSNDVILLKLKLESDSGLGTRLLRFRVLTTKLAAPERLADLLHRVRDWIELTDESDDELDFSQVA